ncbi:MAG: Hsp20/alpha crystallin family protein [Candidatus Sulfobium sp.]|jgi:HSP20 family protein
MAQKESKEMVKVEPTRPLSRFEEFEREFEDFLRRPFSMMMPSWWPVPKIPEGGAPAVDIFEDNGNVVVKAEMPGMTKDELDVKIADNVLTISGEKKKEEKVEKQNYFRMERSYGNFTRSFSLPADVQTDKVKAQFRDGVLEITIPKTAEAIRKQKKIKIE